MEGLNSPVHGSRAAALVYGHFASQFSEDREVFTRERA